MKRLVVSTSAAARLDEASAFLDATAPASEVLVLAATRGAADDLLRRYASESSPVLGRHASTLWLAANELAAPALAERGARPLGGLSTVALASGCVHETAPSLGYFAPVRDMPGLPVALARTMSEMRLEGVASQALSQGGEANRDLERLLEAFERALERWSLVDRAGVLEAAAEAVRSGSSRLVGLPLLVLDVAPRNELEQRLVAELVERAPSCLATAAAGDAVRLESALRVPAEKVEATAGAASLARARIFLFEVEAPEQTEPDSSVAVFSAPGEDRECVEIVRRIRGRVEAGIAFDRIAILLRQPEAYLPLLADALRRGGVPAFFTRGTSRPDPAGRAFLALLACADEGLSASRFAEYLSFGEVPAADSAGAPPRIEVPWVEASDGQLVFKSLLMTPGQPAEPEGPEEPEALESVPAPAHWERLLGDAAVVGGRERWRRRLSGLEREMQLRLREVGDEEEARRAHLEREIRRLDGLRRFAMPLIDDLDELPEHAMWGEWIEQLEALAGRSLRHADRVLALLAELRPMSHVGPLGLGQVRQVLRERLLFLQSDPPRRRYGRVFVATLDEVHGRSFDTVFLPSLAEGLFPRKPFEDPLLLDEDRERLAPGLETQPARFLAERSLLRLAVGAAESRLVASYPRLDQMAGRARVPSFYALDLLRAATGRLPDLHSLESSHAPGQLGWPAPERPESAIDDTEYDLAFLAPLLRSPAAAVRGRARFLLRTNRHLQRSLRARVLRWRPRWYRVDGLVAPGDEALELLRAHLPENRSYSPTALQTLAACPYRFLLYAVHRLHPREDRVSPERLDPLTRGSLFHETQFSFLSTARDRDLLPVHRDFEADLLDVADATLEEVSERYREELVPALPSVWASEMEGLRSDLRGWIRRLLDDPDWAPAHFELAFGLRAEERRDPASTSEEARVLGGARLRGSIDLVERDWKRQRLRVTDHKTGRAPRETHLVVKGGEVLQPVLYALVAEALLASEGETVESGRLFYCTQRGGYREIEVPLTPDSRAAAQSVFDAVENAVLYGFFPAAPREDACRWCDYRAVCGPYEEVRVQRKPQEPLVALHALRKRA
jgi:CRISPR/Cas system-associated exonuclease Cas4 (RecB family)